jgi:dipeptidyl aminopeptidase/acylaminoacyl peptidase
MKAGWIALTGALLFTLGARAETPAAPAAPAQIPTLDFARPSVFQSAKISPNGEYLAVANRIKDSLTLGVVDIKSLKVSAALRFGHGESVSDYWWVSPDRVVVSIATQDGPLDQLRWTGELWGMNADGSNKMYLFGYRGSESVGTHAGAATKEYASAQMLDPMPQDPRHALIAVYPWHSADIAADPLIYRLDVYSGAKDRVGLVPGYPQLGVATDRTGALRFAYSDDRSGVAHAYVMDDEAHEWKEIRFAAGAAKSFTGAFASADGKSAYTIVSDDSNRGCLDEIVIATRQIKEIGCGDGLSQGEILFSHGGSRRPIGVVHDDAEKTAFFATDDPDVKLMKILHNTFPDDRLSVTSATEDGAKLILHTSSDRNPGDFYLLDRASKKAEYLISARDWIDPRRMAAVKPIQYAARDGMVIHGYLTLPPGVTGKAPLVVMPHGGPHSGIHDTWRWDHWAQFLASRGFAVLQPNFRGSGGYGYAFEHAGYHHWGTTMIDDITDGTRWAIEKGYADASRVCIFGASWGGYAALMSAVREPDLYRCSAGLAGVYDLQLQVSDSDTAASTMGRNYLADAVGTDDKVLAEQSPITYVERLKAPVFIIHGTADKRVPFSQAKRLRKALDKYHKQYEWLEKSGEEHGFYKDENNVDFLDQLAAFLDKHIGKSAQVAAQTTSSAAGQQPQ